MSENFLKVITTPLGKVTLIANEKGLKEVVWGVKAGRKGSSLLLEKAAIQLNEYFLGKRKKFTIPLFLEGTHFQKRIWKELCCIPYGETRSYQDIAIKIGKPKATRAVGGANNKNPLAIMIPCHRVIGKNKKLVGYAAGLKKKQQLLQLENKKPDAFC